MDTHGRAVCGGVEVSVEITVGVDVRHWIRFLVEDPTPEEIAVLQDTDSDEALALARTLSEANRLSEIADESDSGFDQFSDDANATVIDCDPESMS